MLNIRKNNKRGFTLVELLVVISIIALLLSILMPALNRAKESAKTQVCKSNLKQLGMAEVLYSMSNKDYFTPYWVFNPDVTPPDGYWWEGRWFFEQMLGKYMSGNQYKAYRCPNGRSAKESSNPVHGNYGLNVNIVGNTQDESATGSIVNATDRRVPVKQMYVKQPGSVILICDSGTFYAIPDMAKPAVPGGMEYIPGCDRKPNSKLRWVDGFATKDAKTGRHPQRNVCIAFVDGHSDVVKEPLLDVTDKTNTSANSYWASPLTK